MYNIQLPSIAYKFASLIGLLALVSGKVAAEPVACPTDFYQLPLVPNATYCQIFDQDLPASMSYFAALPQAEVKAFYLESLGQPDKDDTEHGRIVLLFKQGQHTVIISADGSGSQVDMLVK